MFSTAINAIARIDNLDNIIVLCHAMEIADRNNLCHKLDTVGSLKS